MRRRLAPLALFPVIAIMAACGGGGGSERTAPESSADAGGGAVEYPDNVYDESQVIDYMSLKEVDGLLVLPVEGLTCEVAVVLTSAGAVSLYADAGDVVATNESRTAGVKIVSQNSRACHAAATKALAGL